MGIARAHERNVVDELMEVEAPPNRPDTAPRWDLRRGQEIDPGLIVVDTLGTGSRYETYRAWDRALFCEVAVKLIRPHRVEDDRAIEGFEREATIGMRLGHPNVVRMLRWSAAPPRPFLVMEFVSAPTVGDHLSKTGPVSVPEACLLGIRMACALHHMHSQSVLHLDVKPHNVTMGDPPKLLDLSLARTISGPMRLRHSLGTAPYMAPEQCEHGVVTPQTDVFGLGATLYEAITGMQPFPHGDETSDARAQRFPQLEFDPPPLEEFQSVPDDLSQIVTACLERGAAQRPRSAIDLAVALHRVLEGIGLKELYAWPKGLRVRPT